MSANKGIYPKLNFEAGTVHPINQTKKYILDILSSIGFNNISGPEIETEKCMILFMLKIKSMY
jgi:phenylalanyl-tRNA synthetase alpha subunit